MKTPLTALIVNPGCSRHKKLLTAIVALVSVAAVSRADHYYTNNATGDYTVAAYWNPNGIPSDNTHNDNGSNNIVLIQAGDPLWQHGDTLAGSADNTSGAYLQTGSTNNTGGGNWLRMGLGVNSFGAYVLSNGVVNAGGRIQIGEKGAGYLEISGGTMNANANDASANPGLGVADGNFNVVSNNYPVGTVVLNSGTLNIKNGEVWFGDGNNNANSRGTGHFIMHGGVFNINNWFVFGRFGAAGDGYMDGGVINKNNNGNVQFGVGSMNNGLTPGQAYFTQMGGTFNCLSQYQIGTDANITQATNDIGGDAVLNVGNWLAVGRDDATGTLNISGNASITVSGVNGGNLAIGSGGASHGLVNQSGGAVTNTATQTYIGESGTASGTWNMTNGTAVLGDVYLAYSDTASGVLTLEGGTFRANSISSPTYPDTTTVLDFNGGTLQAGANNANFLSSLSYALVDAGGAIIDSQGYNIGISQVLTDAGGSLTKLGDGTLTLTGANNYSGDTTISAGALFTTTASLTPGSVSLADNTGFGITVLSGGAQYTANDFTLGASIGAALSFDLGSFGNPDAAHAPIAVNGTLSNNGVTTVSVVDSLPMVGSFPLIHYNVLAGSGSFVLGSLPVGVTASIVTNSLNNSIDLNITAVNQPRWDGQAGGTWDTGSDTNWINIGTGLPTAYLDPSLVLFDDEALGVTTVNLTTTVNPIGITVTNDTLDYSIVGTGKISGSTGINKQGAGALALLNTGGNDFTGPMTISGGTVSVTNLPNDGVAGPVGKGSLVLAGGNFSYLGSAASVSHSYTTTAGGSTLTTVSNLTFTGGTFTATASGGLNKSGFANLTYAQTGSNVLAGASSGGFNVQQGSVTFDGSIGGQTNAIGSILRLNGQTSAVTALVTNSVINTRDLGLGDLGNSTNTLTIDGNSTFNMSGWLIFGDGGNAVSTLTLNEGTLNVNTGKILMGGRPFDTSTLNINGGILNNLINNSSDSFDVANGGWNSFGGDGSRTAVVNQSGGTNNCGNLEVGYSTGGTGYYNLTNGQLNVSGLTELGNGGVGTFNLLNGTASCTNGLNIGNSGGVGTMNLADGTLNVNNWFVIGRDGATNCLLNMSGGTINKNNNGSFIIASGAGNNSVTNSGTFNISGGTVNSTGEFWVAENTHATGTNNISGTAAINVSTYVTIGRGGLGVINLSNGAFTQTGANPFMVGMDGGIGYWNQSDGALNINGSYLDIADSANGASTGYVNVSNGTVNVAGDIWVGQASGGNGTMTISGGAVTNGAWLAVGRAGANGVLNVNGGTYVRKNAGGGAGGPNVSVANGGGAGTINVNSGYIDVSAGDTWVGEGSAGAWNQNGGTAKLAYVQLARNASATGIMSLNGGSLTATEITTGNTGATQRELDFNGGTLVAGADNTNFIHDLSAANVGSGGAIIDTAARSVSVNQALLGVSPDGGLTKNGGGALYLNGINTYTNLTQVNAGALGGNGSIAGSVAVASSARLSPGAVSTIGTLTINGSLTLATGSATAVRISMDSGAVSDAATVAASVSYNGTLVVTNAGASPLAVGTQFQLFNAASHSGNFANAALVSILPVGTGSFDPNTGKLTITFTGTVAFNPVKVSGGNLILTGSGGAAPGSGYTLLMSTNVATPLSLWETNATGVLDELGMFSNSIPMNALDKAKFFDVRVP